MKNWPAKYRPSHHKLFRVGYQIRDAHEQPPGRAAVNYAMIEAQREVRFHHRHEPVFARVPTGYAPGCADAEHQRLFRQRDGRRPGQSERAEIRHGGNGTARHFRRELALPGQFDQFVVRPIKSFSDCLSARRMTGTSTPSSASTANAMSIEEGCTIYFPPAGPRERCFPPAQWPAHAIRRAPGRVSAG